MKHFHILPSLVIFTLPARPSSAFYRWRNWGSTRQEAFLSPREEGEWRHDLVPAEGWAPDPAHNSPWRQACEHLGSSHRALHSVPWANTGRLAPRLPQIAQAHQTVCHPMDCSTQGFPVHHQPPELAQTQVHWVSDAIQPSHFLFSRFPPALNLSQHQGVFQRVSSLHQVAKVL